MKRFLTWKRITPWISFFLLTISFFIPVGVFIWLTFFTNTFLVKDITVVDARPHTISAVKDLVKKELDKRSNGKPSHIFFINTNVIEDSLLETIPRIQSVHIVKELPSTVKIIVQEKKPELLMLIKGQYYFVDGNGIVYEKAELQTLPGTVLPIVKNKQSDATVTLGTAAVSKNFVTFVHHVAEQIFPTIQANVVDIHIPSFAAREVTFRLDNNWEIHFDTTRDPQEQLGVLNQLLTATITPEEKASIEYIDLRIPNRVYYKSGL